MNQDWLTSDGQVIHPNAPCGGGGAGKFRSPKHMGDEADEHGIPHSSSPAGRNALRSDVEAKLEDGGGTPALRMLRSMILGASGAHPLPLPSINFSDPTPNSALLSCVFATFDLDVQRHGRQGATVVNRTLRDDLTDLMHEGHQSDAQIQQFLGDWPSWVKGQFELAWDFITRIAARSKDCNRYYKTLGNKTLLQILKEDHIKIHCLVPKPGYTLLDMPDGDTNTDGPQIGINPKLLVLVSENPFKEAELKRYNNAKELIRTLIHELAHVGGATISNDGPHARDAENAISHCGCGNADPDVTG